MYFLLLLQINYLLYIFCISFIASVIITYLLGIKDLLTQLSIFSLSYVICIIAREILFYKLVLDAQNNLESGETQQKIDDAINKYNDVQEEKMFSELYNLEPGEQTSTRVAMTTF